MSTYFLTVLNILREGTDKFGVRKIEIYSAAMKKINYRLFSYFMRNPETSKNPNKFLSISNPLLPMYL